MNPIPASACIPGNLLCMRCHVGGTQPPAPVINPAAHSRHKADGTGHECTTCHMPVTTYMQRHPRHDHGFTIPDPLLTKEFGIPNACNRCHTDKDADWALKTANEFYGEKLNRPTRARAILVARARRGDPPHARDSSKCSNRGTSPLGKPPPVICWSAGRRTRMPRARCWSNSRTPARWCAKPPSGR